MKTIVLDLGELPADLRAAVRELRAEAAFCEGEGAVLTWEKGERLRARIEGNRAVVTAPTRAAFFKGFAYLLCGGCDLPVYADRLSFMADLSRNAVLKEETVRKLLRVLALNGFTELQLYTEDTYEIAEEPYFGHLRGRLTEEEIKRLDEYAALFGIELVPCIQTLAHLNTLLHWQKYQDYFDNGDILFAGEERVYELIGNMLKAARRAYRSGRINIGMDEAALLGAGRYFDKHGYVPRTQIMQKHLGRVLSLCEKYGFRPMMWSDMFFRPAYNGQYYAADEEITPEFLRSYAGQNVELVYWNYYHDDSAVYEKMIAKHAALTENFSFAGGAWKWSGFAPLLSLARRNSAAALSACRRCGVRSLMLTAWGDNGAECSPFAVLPVIAQYSDACYGGFGEACAAPFAVWAGDLNSFFALELPNRLTEEPMWRQTNCSSKYFLYNDPLAGVFDSNVPENARAVARRNGEAIAAARGKVKKEYGYLFDTLASLCGVLELKTDFGVRAKEAYDRGDKPALAALAEECGEIVRRLQNFYRRFSAQWSRENVPFGFEVQTARLGGLMQRMKDAARILRDYATGKTDGIPELAHPRLDFMGGGSRMSRQADILYNNYAFSASVNVM